MVLMGLKKGLCDIFISMEMPEVSPIMNKIAISREEVRAFMPDTHLLCKKECVDYTDLNGQKYLYLKGFEYWKDRILQELLAEQIYPSAIIPCDQVEELGMRLQRENAVALLPYCIRHMNRSYIVSRPLKKIHFGLKCMFITNKIRKIRQFPHLLICFAQKKSECRYSSLGAGIQFCRKNKKSNEFT